MVMTNTSTPSIGTLCVHCGGKLADPQTGRCLSCGKIVMSPGLAAEFSHPTLNRHAGEPRHSPSATYRYGHDIPPPAEQPAKTPDVEVAEATVALRDYFEEKPKPTPKPTPNVPVSTPTKAEPLKLPGSPKTRAWVEQAKVLRDSMVAAAERAEAAAKASEQEARRYRAAASVFIQVLDQVQVDEQREPDSGGRRYPRRGEWSAYGSACIDCGRNDLPHCAHGRCRPCDDKWRRTRSVA